MPTVVDHRITILVIRYPCPSVYQVWDIRINPPQRRRWWRPPPATAPFNQQEGFHAGEKGAGHQRRYGEGYGWRRDGNGAPAATPERRTKKTAENHRADALGQRGQPGVHSGATEDRVRAMLGRLRSGGWVASVLRGMTERRQHRWFLTSKAVELLYTTDHQHPSPREEARASGLAAFHPEGEFPEDFQERFALDHDHSVHLEDHESSPFAAGEPADQTASGNGVDHEHPPWTATSRGMEMSLRRLAMLEPVYRLAPDLLRSGRVNWPADNDAAATREVRMTDFRLLRRGGFYQAVARYGEQVWTPFTYTGLHATERVIRRKEQHRFWGWTATPARKTATCASATAPSTRTRTRRWNPRPRW